MTTAIEIKLSHDRFQPSLRACVPGFGPANYSVQDQWSNFCRWWNLVGRTCCFATTGKIVRH